MPPAACHASIVESVIPSNANSTLRCTVSVMCCFVSNPEKIDYKSKLLHCCEAGTAADDWSVQTAFRVILGHQLTCSNVHLHLSHPSIASNEIVWLTTKYLLFESN